MVHYNIYHEVSLEPRFEDEEIQAKNGKKIERFKTNMSEDSSTTKPPKGHFYLAGRLFPRVKWWKSPKMRALYFYILVLILTNTANGFDNSMM